MQPPASSTMLRPGAPSPLPIAPQRRLATAKARYHSDGAGSMSGGPLLVALYERLVRDLVGAEASIEERDVENAHLQLVHAQEIVDALDAALDPAWDQAAPMSQIYAHVRRELVDANMTKSTGPVASCRRIIEPLAATWQEALVATQTAAPVGVS